MMAMEVFDRIRELLLVRIAYSLSEHKNEMRNIMYIYPDNLKAKAALWLWQLRDVAIFGSGLLLSVFAAAELGTLIPFVITAVYGFLSIRFSDTSILDFIRYAVAFFISKQQYYEWTG